MSGAVAVDHVVVLDVDDTLYLERDYVASGYAAVGRQVADELGRGGFAEAAARRFASGERTRIFDLVLEELGIAVTPELIDRLVGHYRDHEPAIAMEPDAAHFIARDAPGRGLAIVSDGFLVAQQAKVRALGVDRARFGPVMLTDEFGWDWWKPNERCFQHIQAHFALPPNRFAYVADNPGKDFVGPQKLGWKTIRMRREGGLHEHSECDPPVDLEIRSFDALTEPLIDSLFDREFSKS
jgi:putative hydrolase of the HAD superfamily